ncbi:hypothetical protein TthHB5018_b23190 (plasmid) [Thermus thermophilus]|uniref:Uncharacterized protein n=1 Tax=Thermus thermophilus TaxID=274 RepID=A0A7R7TG93_THETH|nr:hypothetical protein TthHB5018_b23190 [Thermus thermophilus]
MHPFPKELLPGGLEVGLQGPLGRGVGGEAGNLDVTGVGPEEDRPRPLLEAGVLEDEGRGEEVGGEHFLHEVPARLPHGSPPRLPHGVDQEVQGPHLLQEGLGLQLVGEVRGKRPGPNLPGELRQGPGPPPREEEVMPLQGPGKSAAQAPCGPGDEDAHGLHVRAWGGRRLWGREKSAALTPPRPLVVELRLGLRPRGRWPAPGR